MKSSTKALITICIFLYSFVHSNKIQLVPALYIFGDSIVDGGNSFPPKPYGIDLNDPSIRPRSTNGLTIADFITMSLGLPIVPPYKNSELSNTSTTGVNYAYSGSGILPETKMMKSVWTFDEQIDRFEYTRADHLAKIYSWNELTKHLAESIFLVSFGINDYSLNYITPNKGKTPDIEPEIFAHYLLNALSQRLTRLYRLGGRKFIMTNIWPLGCTPPWITSGVCNDEVNDMLLPYNNSLPIMLKHLSTDLPDFQYSYSDDFNFVQYLSLNPEKTGIANTTGKCYIDQDHLCLDRDSYLYFDDIHPTEAANSAFSSMCFDGNLCSPTIDELARA